MRLHLAAGLVVVVASVPALCSATVGTLSADDAMAACDGDSRSPPYCSSNGQGLQARTEPFGLVFRPPWTIPEVPGGAATRRVSYPIETSLGRVVPTVVYVPDPAARVPGLVSIALERAPAGDPVALKAEVGWSGRPSGSLDLGYRGAERQASLHAEQRAAAAAVLPGGRLPGSAMAGGWTERLGPRASASVSVTGDRVDFDGRTPEATARRLEVRLRAADGWNLFAGMSASSYADAVNAEVRRAATSIGADVGAAALNLTAVVRDETTSAMASGLGARIALSGNQAGWSARLYADVQQQAAVIELEGSAAGDLPRELADAGLVAIAPEAVIPLLRDRGTLLLQNGLAPGAMRVDPLRVRSGFDLTWRDAGPQRTEFGVLLATDDLQGVGGAQRRGLLGQLQMSWRVMSETDLTASYASWSIQGEPSRDESRSLFRLSLKSRL